MTDGTTVGGPVAVAEAALSAATGDLLTVCTRPALVRAITAASDEVELPADVRLLIDESTAGELRRDFLAAIAVVDLVEEHGIEVRTAPADDLPVAALFLGEEEVATVVPAGADSAGAFHSGDDELVSTLGDAYDERWDAAAEHSFRTPARSVILDTLATDLDDELRADVAAALDADATAAALDRGVDPIDVVVLVAAKNAIQLYELSRWGERIGLASPAKFSQSKQRLEEEGLIATEKIPQERGRPRQRLVAGPELPDDPSVEELVALADEVLGSD